MSDFDDLPLFQGPHLAAVRFQQALARLDLEAAVRDSPEALRESIQGLRLALRRGSVASRLSALLAARQPDWPPELDEAWNRLVGQRLDGTRPELLDGQPAAVYLLRGGDEQGAHESIGRHLAHRPTDAAAWSFAARWLGEVALVRAAFHGGPVPPELRPLADQVEEDEQSPVGRWLLPYAFLAGKLDTDEVKDALDAERISQPLPLAGDGAAFAWYLVELFHERKSGGAGGPREIEARRRLQKISAPTLRRLIGRS